MAPTSWTLPSHMTLLTSLPPERHGITKAEMSSKLVDLAIQYLRRRKSARPLFLFVHMYGAEHDRRRHRRTRCCTCR